jgi:hypothetical protein
MQIVSIVTGVLLAFLSTCCCHAFVPSSNLPVVRTFPLSNTNNGADVSSDQTKLSLEDKMKSWEATEDEIKAASLGGVVPKGSSAGERSDAFDVGLYILFPVMIVGLGLFAFFPILVQNIDVTSVGPPPTS